MLQDGIFVQFDNVYCSYKEYTDIYIHALDIYRTKWQAEILITTLMTSIYNILLWNNSVLYTDLLALFSICIKFWVTIFQLLHRSLITLWTHLSTCCFALENVCHSNALSVVCEDIRAEENADSPLIWMTRTS